MPHPWINGDRLIKPGTLSTFIGTTNFDFVDSVGVIFGTGNDITMLWDGTRLAVTQAAADSEIYWGVSGAGINHTWFGDTAGRNMSWDQTNDQLLFADNAKLSIGSGAGAAGDISFSWNATKMLVAQLTANSAIDFGVSGAGIDIQCYGDTAGRDMLWDQSADSLLFLDDAKLAIGTGSDIVFSWDATRLNVTQAAVNSEIRWGVDGAGIDQVWYGDTASASLVWDQSADRLVVNGVAGIQGLRTISSSATAITTTRVLTLADAGGVFSVSQASAYDIDVPDPTTGPGCRYTFYLTGAAANSVTITCAGAATFVGTIVNDVTSVLPCTGNTLTFVTGTAALGDSIEFISISTSLYLVRAVSSAAGGITIA